MDAVTDELNREVIFGRMIGLVTEAELADLSSATIAVPGCGGVGFTHAETLIRMGVGGVNISDFDTFGPENFNRQFGATVHTLGKSKALVLEGRLKSINPMLRTMIFDGVRRENLERFLDAVDIVCDAMDYFVIEPRILMYRKAREKNIPVVVSGPIGFGATLQIFDPNGMSFEEYYNLSDDQTEEDKLLKFGIGLNPGKLHRSYLDDPKLNFETRKVASLSSSCLLCSSLVGAFTIGKLLKRKTFFRPVPYVYQIDLMTGTFVEQYIPGGVKSLEANEPIMKGRRL